MASIGIRKLKNNLSRYIGLVEAGERISVMAHGRIVAELGPPGPYPAGRLSHYDSLIASGAVRPPLESGDPLADWPEMRLPAGTAARVIDADRSEPYPSRHPPDVDRSVRRSRRSQ